MTGGSLIVNGTLGDVTLDAGSTLGGTGTLGALTANGRVAPGNSIGTLNSGPVTFGTGRSWRWRPPRTDRPTG